jgi:hypothetical protein
MHPAELGRCHISTKNIYMYINTMAYFVLLFVVEILTKNFASWWEHTWDIIWNSFDIEAMKEHISKYEKYSILLLSIAKHVKIKHDKRWI